MEHLQNNPTSKAIPIINPLIFVVLVVLFFGIFSVSKNWISSKMIPVESSTENNPTIDTIPREDNYDSSKVIESIATDVKKKTPATDEKSRINKNKQESKKIRQARLSKEDKAMVVMILMSLKNRKM